MLKGLTTSKSQKGSSTSLKNYISFLKFLNITTYKIWPSYYFVILFKVLTESFQLFIYSLGVGKLVEYLFQRGEINTFAVYFWLGLMIFSWIIDNLASNLLEMKRLVFYRKAHRYLGVLTAKTLQKIPYVYFESTKFQTDLKTFESIARPKFLQATDLLPNFLKSALVFVLSFGIFVFKYQVALLILLGVVIEIFMLKPAVVKYNNERDKIAGLRRYVDYFSVQILELSDFRLNKVYNLFGYLSKKLEYFSTKLEKLLYKLQKELAVTRIITGNLGNIVGRFIPWIYYTILAIKGQIAVDQYVFIFGLVSRVHNKTFVFMRTGLELYSVSNYYDILQAFLTGSYYLEDNNLKKYIYVQNDQGYAIQRIESLAVKDVSFKYLDMKTWLLKDLNLEFYSDKPSLITGPNGAGKTTLFYILYGLFKPLKGEVFINNKPLENIDLQEYRRHVGYVLQQMPNTFLPAKDSIALLELAYSGTDFNGKDIDKKRLKQALLMAEAQDVYDKIKDNLDVTLGKFFAEGVELSGGQWRKLAIARLFYYNPDVYMLDEPFVNIDVSSRKKILDNLIEVATKQNKLLIIVSHLPEVEEKIRKIDGQVIKF